MAKKQALKQIVPLTPEQRQFLENVLERLNYLIEQERLGNIRKQKLTEFLKKGE